MLQAGRAAKNWNWSKASRLGKLAPSVEIDEKLELEQSKLVREACSKSGDWRKAVVGVKQAG